MVSASVGINLGSTTPGSSMFVLKAKASLAQQKIVQQQFTAVLSALQRYQKNALETQREALGHMIGGYQQQQQEKQKLLTSMMRNNVRLVSVSGDATLPPQPLSNAHIKTQPVNAAEIAQDYPCICRPAAVTTKVYIAYSNRWLGASITVIAGVISQPYAQSIYG